MDQDIEKYHSVLLAAHLPSSINDLKNPTEEFVVNLINTFLTKFHIDVGLVDKPTMEQQDVMMYYMDSNIIVLVNLYAAMVQIYDRIFFKDFYITDITCPSSKRVRKQAKYLANFTLYANEKECDIQDRVDEIYSRAQLLQDILDKKTKVQESVKDKQLHNMKQLSLHEKYLADSKNLQSKIETSNKRDLELIAEMTAAEERKQKAVELRGSYKTEAVKLNKAITELQPEIVNSPEEYQSRLRELEEQDKLKGKEKEVLHEAFQDKKQLIEQLENILAFIQKQLDTFPETQEIFDQLKKAGGRKEKQIETSVASATELEKKLAALEAQYKELDINEFHGQCKESLSPLRDMNARLSSNKKSAELKLEEEKARHNGACLEKNKMQGVIKKLEEEISAFTKNCQELYDSEIMIERDLWKTYAGE